MMYTYNHICTHITTYMYKYIHTYKHIHIHTYVHVHTCTSSLKNHIRYNNWTVKYVDLYLYDQLQITSLEKSQIHPQILPVYF